MDYPHQHRIKIWGTAEFIEDDPSLLDRVTDAGYAARPQRVLVFHVKAWDVNCTQHIQKRYTAEEMQPIVEGLHERITELEAKNKTLESRLAAGIEPVFTGPAEIAGESHHYPPRSALRAFAQPGRHEGVREL